MWICPNCERELRNPNQWHYCEKVNISDLFKGKNKELEILSDQIISVVIQWENVAVSATKNCIVAVHNKTFLVLRPMKTQLDIKYYSDTEHLEPPVIKSIPYAGKFENHIRISTVDELTVAVYQLIKQSYIIS